MRRRAGLGVIVLAAAAWTASSAPLQDGGGPKCMACKQVGLVPCGEHRGLDLALEHGVEFCSFVSACESCAGTGWLDCERCESPEVEARNERKRAQVAASAARLAELDEKMERPLRKASTAHFDLVWEVDELKVGKRRLDDHELLHLYLDRMEELFTAYTTTLGVEELEFKERSRLFVWYFLEDHRHAAKVFCGNAADRGVKLLGATPSYTVMAAKRYFKDDEALHRNLVHNTSHLLLSHQRPSHWMGQTKAGWADAGVAHWFEDHFFGVCDNYCYQEVNTQANFKGGKWRPAIRKLVATDDAPPAAGVMQKNTTVLTPAEHAVSFSYVDFLIATDAAKTNKLLKRLRSKVETRDALSEAFGWSVLEFEAAWKAWVLATYPSR